MISSFSFLIDVKTTYFKIFATQPTQTINQFTAVIEKCDAVR
jgi:hypothetical protein